MKILKKILTLIIVPILFLNCIIVATNASLQLATEKPVKVAVFLNNLSNLLISDAKRNLVNIQKQSQNKMTFTFFDSKDNQGIQNETIEKELINNYDLFVVKPVSGNVEYYKNTLNRIMRANIPLIMYLPRATQSLVEIIRGYGKGFIITGDIEQGATIEGNILANAWNSNKGAFDKNKDNIMQYILLQGPSNNESTTLRTKYSIQALNEAKIKTEQISSTHCNWNRDCAKKAIESSFLTLGNKIEAIIAHNDEMAIGSIEALQKYGFNKGDKSKYIPVVGIGGSPEAKNLIAQGIMLGTVYEDLPTEAEAIYAVGMNLVSGNLPLKGTNLKFDETGITVKIPYKIA